MTVDQFVSQYGLLAVFAGAFVEGETVAITGGVFAHRKLLVLWQVTVVAGLAVYLSDMSYFVAGRRFREHKRLKSIMERPGFARVVRAVDQNATRFASVFRFVPGMRIVGPLALAQSRISTSHFALIAAVAAVVWSVIYTIMGHAVGMAIHAIFGRVHRGEVLLILPVVVLIVVTGVMLHRKYRHQQA